MLSRSVLADITEPRLEEILGLVRRELERHNHMQSMASGIVLHRGTVMSMESPNWQSSFSICPFVLDILLVSAAWWTW